MAIQRRRRKFESALQSLIEILKDSQEGLVTIGERLGDLTLKRYFFAESLKRAQFIDELEALFRNQGFTKIREVGSAAGALHRTWARFKSHFVSGDHALLVSAERGEHAITQFYDHISRIHLPLCVRRTLAVQSRHLHMAYGYIKAARDRTANAHHQTPAAEYRF